MSQSSCVRDILAAIFHRSAYQLSPLTVPPPLARFYTQEALGAVSTEGASTWSPECAAALQAFLASPAGLALTRRLNAIVTVVASNGARNTNHTVHAAGMSAGWDEAVRTLYQLAQIQPPQPSLSDMPHDHSDTPGEAEGF